MAVAQALDGGAVRTGLTLAACLAFGLAPRPATAQTTASGHVALKGTYIEVGVNKDGFFGLPKTEIPSGYHWHSDGANGLGFVADYRKNGFAGQYGGDYFTPGSPFEGFAVKWVGAATRSFLNAGARGVTIPTTSLTNTSAGSVLSAVWVGEATSGTEKLKIVQTYRFNAADLFFTANVQLINTGSATLTAVKFAREVDPDNDVSWTGSYSTANLVVNQPPSATNKALVTATGTGVTDMTLGLGAIDARAKVTANLSGTDPDPILNSPVSSVTADVWVGLAFNVGDLAPGQSASLDYAYILSANDLDAALGSLAAITIQQPTGTVSGTSVPFQVTTNDVAHTTQVDFYVNGSLIGSDTAPTSGIFETSFNSTTYPNGSLSLKAVATINGTAVEKSSTVIVDNSGPPMAFASPSNGQTVNGDGLVALVNGTDALNPPTQVTFYREVAGKTTVNLGTVNAAPFSATYNTSDLAAGTAVTIRAVGKNAGGQQTNITVSVSTASAFTVVFQTDGTASATLTGTASQSIAPGGSTSAVTANAPASAYFVDWTGTGGFTSTANPVTISGVSQAMTVTAHFAAKAASALSLDASPNPAAFGQPVHFTASVTPAGATGSVQFTVDGQPWGLPVPLVDGVATSPDLSSLAVGSHAVGAVYGGDATHLASTGSFDGGLTVQQVASSTALSSSTNPSRYGQAVHLEAQVTAAGTATGTIHFLFGSASLAIVDLDGTGKAALDVTSLPAGTDALTAAYSGDSNVLPSTSGALSQVVSAAPTTTVLLASSLPALHGVKVTFTAKTSPSYADAVTPTGTATLFDGETVLGIAPLIAGAVAFELSTLPVGDHRFIAVYAGDGNFSGSTSSTLNGAITPSCAIASSIYAPATANPGNPCQVCDPAINSTDWTNRASGFACPADAFACTSDVCDGAGTCTHPVIDGCLVGGACVPANASAPGAECTQCNPALSTTAYTSKAKGIACTDDGSAITDDYCDGAGLCVHPLKNECSIGGVTYPGGTTNPANSCQSCDALASNSSWTNRVSGFPCTDDGLSCTWDSCDGAGSCQHRLFSGCLIDGACVASFATDPTNDCQECLPALATDTYSPRAQGVACADDGKPNTLDVCDGSSLCVHPLRGQCSIAGKSYDEGTVNPDNPCQSCDPASTSQDWTNRGAGFPCTSDDLACTRDVCDGAGACTHPLFTGCLVAGACVGSGAADPADECRACNPAQSTAGYVAKAQGVSCADDGLANTLDICDGTGACVHPLKGQCTIDGATYDAGTANPQNPCQSCDPATSATAWSNHRSGFPCTSDGLACTDDVCDGAGTCTHPLFTGCLISGACVSAGSLDPANDCRTCDPAASTSAYSSRASGTSCGSDSNASTLDVCDGSGSCVHPLKGQCTIAGAVYDSGATNPRNPCQSCDPTASVSNWTNRVPEFPCTSDRLSCTDDVCDGAGLCLHRLHTGCLIDGACVAPGVADPANACDACDPHASTSAFSPRPRGVACTDDGNVSTLDVCDGQGACLHPLNGQCTVDGKTYDSGTPDPQNPCQACDSAASTTAWTLRAKGFPCTSDGLTCTDDTCDGAGACQHPVAAGCLISGACVSSGAADPTSDCRECNPALSTTAYSLKQNTAACVATCELNTDCPSGTWCGGEVCRPKLAAQTACSIDAQCVSGHCQNAVCAPVAVSSGCGCASTEGSQAASALFLGLLTLALAARRRLAPARSRARR